MVSMRILKAHRDAGGITVVAANKRGVEFRSAQDMQAVADSFSNAITNEVLSALAVRAVGAANVAMLTGKLVTVTISVAVTA